MSKLINFGIIISTICLIIKSFLIILQPRGDAAVFLGIKYNPFQENFISQYDYQIDGKYPIIYTDELELIWEPILQPVFRIPLLIYFAILLMLVIIKFRLKRTR